MLVPPSALKWKAIVLPGLLCGILLTTIQFFVVLLCTGPASSLDFPFFPHNTPTVYFFIWLFYLVIPALPALLVTFWTRQRSLGYRAGQLAGMSCAVILIVATLTYPLPYLHPHSTLQTPLAQLRLLD
jgi:hypothetical protein